MIQDTSRLAYCLEKPEITLQKNQLLNALRRIPVACDLSLAEYLDWPINIVTARRNELVGDGKVIEAGRGKSPITGRKVIFWRTSEFRKSLF